ncbi:hypothetical protein ACS0TY_027351 [Phlomoides rotata]
MTTDQFISGSNLLKCRNRRVPRWRMRRLLLIASGTSLYFIAGGSLSRVSSSTCLKMLIHLLVPSAG